jgi:hypothetical protein
MWLDYLAILSPAAQLRQLRLTMQIIVRHSRPFAGDFRQAPGRMALQVKASLCDPTLTGGMSVVRPISETRNAFQWTLPILELRPSDASRMAKRCFKSQISCPVDVRGRFVFGSGRSALWGFAAHRNTRQAMLRQGGCIQQTTDSSVQGLGAYFAYAKLESYLPELLEELYALEDRRGRSG